MIIKYSYIIYFLFCFLLVDIFANKTLKFVYEDYPPYEYSDSTKSLGINGLHAKIIKKVFSKMDYQVSFEELPWARANEYVENGIADGIFSLFKTKKRQKYLHYPNEILSIEKIKLFKNPTEQIKKINNFNDLKGLSIGIVRGYSCGEKFDNTNWLIKEPTKDTKTLVKKQAYKRTDISALNEFVVLYLANKYNLKDKISIIDFIVSEEPLYLAFSKKKWNANNKLLIEFDKELKKFKQSGEYQKIMNELLNTN